MACDIALPPSLEITFYDQSLSRSIGERGYPLSELPSPEELLKRVKAEIAQTVSDAQACAVGLGERIAIPHMQR
jgi:hypothetical protein